METNWSKVFEVFGSGIIGVFLVMILLQILTQLSTKVIDVIEGRDKSGGAGPEPKKQDVSVRD